ncbi:MAG: hypothetical protein EOO15_01600 [Chitinophagaceae bacterium]|nr:MAG: hypothetical protein EOO15_01600 [Chitinophagaceae bacterium]
MIKRRVHKIACFCAASLFLMACHHQSNSEKKIVGEAVDKYGLFVFDTIPHGEITFFKHGTDTIIGVSNYKFGLLNGETKFFFRGKLVESAFYNSGRREGYSEHFDSLTGNMVDKEYYWAGRKLGPQYTFLNGALKKYSFIDFENREVFSADKINPQGQLVYDDFSYLLRPSVAKIFVEGKQMLEVFFYQITPPLMNVRYSIVHLNQSKQVVDSSIVNNNLPFWHGYIDLSFPSKPGLQVNIFDSTTSQEKVIIAEIH